LLQYAPIIIFTVLAITIAVFYTYIISKKSPGEQWNWWHGLIATLVSVLLGVSIAIGIFFFQNDVVQNQDKRKYTSLVSTELAATWQGLQAVDNPLNINFDRKTYSFHIGFLQSVVLGDAARSGLFNEEETRTLLKLTRWIQFHNMNLNLLISVIPQSRNDILSRQKIEMIYVSHIKTRNEIIKDIQIANRQFDLPGLNKRIQKFPPKSIGQK